MGGSVASACANPLFLSNLKHVRKSLGENNELLVKFVNNSSAKAMSDHNRNFKTHFDKLQRLFPGPQLVRFYGKTGFSSRVHNISGDVICIFNLLKDNMPARAEEHVKTQQEEEEEDVQLQVSNTLYTLLGDGPKYSVTKELLAVLVNKHLDGNSANFNAFVKSLSKVNPYSEQKFAAARIVSLYEAHTKGGNPQLA